jgi:hypothetical protein
MRGRMPLGQDADGNSYHWYDMPYDHDAPVGLMGSRLYVEGPPQQPGSEQQQQHQQQQGADKDQQQKEKAMAKRESDGGDTAAPVDKPSGKPPLPPAR